MTLFTDLAPRIMTDLIREFDLEMLDAAAIVGNLGHESGGFKFLQEIKPLVPGSKGGYGWAQWTGPRRKQFEAFIKEHKYKPESYEANFNFLVWELKNTETKAIPATKAAKTLFEKVKAFEKSFERAGIKHYPARNEYALKAMQAFEAQPKTEPKPAPEPTPEPEENRKWWEALIDAILMIFGRH
jgi:hypothetical protein